MIQALHPLIAEWYHHCPHCQAPLVKEPTAARCSQCEFVFYLNPAPTTVVLVEKEHTIMLTKRGIEPHKGKWSLPGGFVNSNETVEECAIREMKEETDLTIKIVAQLGPAFPDVYSEKQDPTLNFMYVAQVVSGTPKPMDDVAALEWYAVDEIDMNAFAFENDREAIRRYKLYIKENHEH